MKNELEEIERRIELKFQLIEITFKEIIGLNNLKYKLPQEAKAKRVLPQTILHTGRRTSNSG